MRFLVALALFCATAATLAQGNVGNAVVIVLAQFQGFNAYELGTGAFIDHDGLIVTADHVVHHITVTPPTSFANSTVSATAPTKLTVYSPYLNQSFDVDLTNPANLLGGQISPNEWLDAALIRVQLSDVQRAQIQPLDFAMTAPVQQQQLYAYGSKCDDATVSFQVASSNNCLQSGVIGEVLSTDPAVSREYQTGTGTTLGYSGGPLVDGTGAIVGIASWGDVIPSTSVVVRQLYLPARYLIGSLLPNVLASPKWTGANACNFASSIHIITIADSTELSRQWSTVPPPDAAQCACCCQSMDKMRSPYPPPPSQCSPPWACTPKRLYALANAADLASTSDTEGAKSDELVSAIQAAYTPENLATLSVHDRQVLLSTVGKSLASLSIKRSTQNPQSSAKAGSVALGLLLSSQNVPGSHVDYAVVSRVFAAQNDQTGAAAAEILSATSGTDPAVLTLQLHIDTSQLESSIATAAQRLAVTANAP